MELLMVEVLQTGLGYTVKSGEKEQPFTAMFAASAPIILMAPGSPEVVTVNV
jgi:hypothetical protein